MIRSMRNRIYSATLFNSQLGASEIEFADYRPVLAVRTCSCTPKNMFSSINNELFNNDRQEQNKHKFHDTDSEELVIS